MAAQHNKHAGDSEEVVLRGIGVSPGVVVGEVFLLVSDHVGVPEYEIQESEVEHEICRLEDALIETRRQIKAIQKDLESRAGVRNASILDAHLMVLDDRSFIEDVLKGIKAQRKNVEFIVKSASDRYADVLASVQDDYLRERVADIHDVARRVIRNLSGTVDTAVSDLKERHVVVANDLAPSETAGMRKDMVTAFATDLGSPTSHTAVMARALEIPAVVGLHDISEHVSTGDEMLIDGNKGVVIIHPTPESLEKYGKVAAARRDIERELTRLKNEPAVTKDGHGIVLSANVEGPEEAEAVLTYGAEGIGLFRSEYLFLAKGREVSEEEQTEVYLKVARRLAPAPVIIRTLDIGGDKLMSGDSSHQKEANPFLGCRSIRLSLLFPDQFKGQLRAILRASVEGNVKIMYPMISGVSQVIRANELLVESKQELADAGVAFDKDLEVGVMIEVPSAALTADAIAKHVDFFSLGTNDLIQYTLAVDRVNERVAYLYEPTHPAVLRLISETVDAGHRNGIWVGLCGEMAADPLMTPLLLGMGIDELSVAPSAVPVVKDAIRSVHFSRAKELVETALKCDSPSAVLNHCRKLTKEVAPELLELI